MIPQLIVRKGGKTLRTVALDKQMFNVGRGDENDLDLDDKAVSREHAIFSKGQFDTYYIKDVGAQNGIFLNGTRIYEKTALQINDVIKIGPFEIHFMPGEGTIIDPPPPPPPPPGGGARKGNVKLTCLEGPLKPAEYESWKGDLTIGRGAGNVIVLPDDATSKEHAKISEHGGAYYISDLRSANGTFVQGKRILQKQRLRNGDLIRIGMSSFKFTDIDAAKKKRLMMTVAGVVGALLVAGLLVVLLLPHKKEEPTPVGPSAETLEAQFRASQLEKQLQKANAAIANLEARQKEIREEQEAARKAAEADAMDAAQLERLRAQIEEQHKTADAEIARLKAEAQTLKVEMETAGREEERRLREAPKTKPASGTPENSATPESGDEENDIVPRKRASTETPSRTLFGRVYNWLIRPKLDHKEANEAEVVASKASAEEDPAAAEAQAAAKEAEAAALKAKEEAARQAAIQEQAAMEAAAVAMKAKEEAARQAVAQEQAAKEAEAATMRAKEEAAKQATAQEQAGKEAEAAAMKAREEAARQAAAQEQAAKEAEAAAMRAKEEAARQATIQEQAAKEAEAAALKAKEEAARQAAAQEQAAKETEAAAMKAREEAAKQAAAQEQAAKDVAATESETAVQPAAMPTDTEPVSATAESMAAAETPPATSSAEASPLFDPAKKITLDSEIAFESY